MINLNLTPNAQFDPETYDLASRGGPGFGMIDFDYLKSIGATNDQIRGVADRAPTIGPAAQGALSTLSMPSFDPQAYDVSGGFGMNKFNELKGLGLTDEQITQVATRSPIVGDRIASMFPQLSSWGANQAVDFSIIPPEFDWVQYVKSNPDLIAADIDTGEEARRHYALYGYKENRPNAPPPLSPPKPVDPLLAQLEQFDVTTGFGMKKYDELKALGATDKQIAEIAARAPIIGERAAELFPELSSWGAKDEVDLSVIPPNFNWIEYLNANPDLDTAGIDTEAEAKRHYALFGSKEGRPNAPELLPDKNARYEKIRAELETQYNNLVALGKKQGQDLTYRGRSSDLPTVWNQQAAQLADAGVTSIANLRIQDGKLIDSATGNVVTKSNLGGQVAVDRDTGVQKWGDIFSGVKGGANYGIQELPDSSVLLFPAWEKTKSPLAQIGLGDFEQIIGPALTIIGAYYGMPGMGAVAGTAAGAAAGNTVGQYLASGDVDWEQVAASAALAAAVPAAPKVGATLAPGASAATQAMVGAGAVSAGTQLVLTGEIDPGKLAVSVATAGLSQTGGLTGEDIAADAAQLADQGLSASQISDTLVASGVNSVTANLAGTFASTGVPVELAPALSAGTTNMSLVGLQSIVSDGSLDIDALTRGFVTGASGGASEVAVSKIVGDERIATISQELGLSQDQTKAIMAESLASGLNAEILGTGNFAEEIAQSLVVNGASFATANKIAKELDGLTSEKGRAAIVSASKDIVKVAGNAAWDGLDVGSSIELMAPTIIQNAVSSYARAPGTTPKKEEDGVQVAGEVNADALKALADKPLIGEEATEPVTDAEGVTRRTVTGVDNDGKEYSYQIVKDAEGNVSYSYQTQSGDMTTSTTRPDFRITTEESTGAEVTPVKPPSEIGEKPLAPAFDKTKALEDISKEPSFSSAFDKARDLLGPGETFTWNGQSYSTATAEERPDLVTTKPGDNTQTDTGAAFHSNIGKNYSPEDMRILEMAISDNASKLPPPTSEVDFISATVTGQEVPVVGDKISRDVAAPFVTALGTLTRGTAGIVDYTRGTLEAIEAIDSTSPLAKGMRDLSTSMKETADFQIGDWALDQERQFVSKVQAAEGLANKTAAIAQAIYEHPSAVLTLSGSELMEEIPSVVAMIATGGASKLLSLSSGLLLNAIESGGQAYNEAIALGGTQEQAQKAAAGSAAVGAVLGTFAEAPLVRGVFKSTSPVASTVKREVATEFPEEFAQTGMVDYFGTGKFDLNNAQTAAVISVPIAGTTSGAMGTAISLDRTSQAADMVISANDPENAAQISNEISSILGSSDSIQDATQSIATSLEGMGLTNGAATAIANTVAAEQVVNNINQALPEGSKFEISNLNTLIGASSEGSPVTLGEYIGGSVSDLGPTMFVQPDIVIGTKTDGSVMTVGDLSGAFKMNSSPDVEITQETNPDTGVTTKTETENNVTTTTTTDPNTNIKTESVVNPNTNTQVDINVDNNTNTVVATKTNTDTNVKTDVSSNVDALIEELIEAGMPPDQALIEAVNQTKKEAKTGAAPTGAKKETGGDAPMFTSTPMEESEFESSSLYTRGKPREFESALAGYLSRVRGSEDIDTAESTTKKEPTMSADYFIYGKPTEIDEILGAPGNEITAFNMPEFGFRQGGLVPAFADGGPLTMAAGKLRRDYREGDAVEGPGDGQSDDIPAMLADGEFVIPADVVAALGNGSNKAGADKLYEMMHNIRRDYRKAKPKDLPKPAKSPLSYITRRS